MALPCRKCKHLLVTGEMHSCRAIWNDPQIPMIWRTKVPAYAQHKFLFPIDFLPELGPEDCPQFTPYTTENPDPDPDDPQGEQPVPASQTEPPEAPPESL